MNARRVWWVVIAAVLAGVPGLAQTGGAAAPLAPRYSDPANGLSLDDAIARALQQEPSLRAARAEVDVARGMQLQAGLRPNPSVAVDRREEPSGTDNQTTIAVQWPLDLFRRKGRITVAEREIAATRLAAADRERLLASDVRARYGDVLGAVRNLAILDDIVTASRRQLDLLRARVDEGASPPLERDLLDVELRRLEADRLLQAGRTEAALFELKRVLGMQAGAALAVREELEDLVQRETASPVAASSTPSVLQQRADVRQAEARLTVADAAIERARADGRFDVSLSGNYMRMNAGFPQLGFTQNGSLQRVGGLFHYVSIGATVTVPVLNRNEGSVAAARAAREGAAAALDASRLAAETEVMAARTLDEHARQALDLYGAGAQALARQNLAVVGQSYELGRVTVFDVLAEQRRYLDVQRAYTEALQAAYEARTALTRALGERP
jgi:cobalt-zinc-cadmium efflux system outer membrane protein